MARDAAHAACTEPREGTHIDLSAEMLGVLVASGSQHGGLFGRGRLHWGVAYPGARMLGAGSLGGEHHPPYADIVNVELQQIHLGMSPANTPSIDLLAMRRPVLPAAWDPAAWPGGVYANRQVNIVMAVVEARTHPRWGGGELAAQRLHEASWRAMAWEVDHEDYSVAPLVTRQRDLDEWCEDILGLFDMYVWEDADGLLRIGRHLADGLPVDVSALTELSDNDFTDPPDLKVAPGKVLSERRMTCIDPSREAFKTVGLVVHLPHIARTLDTSVAIDEAPLRGDCITDLAQGERILRKMAQHETAWSVRGTVHVRAPRAVRLSGGPLEPGDKFLLNWLAHRLAVVCYVEEVSASADGQQVSLRIRSDRGETPLPYVGPAELLPDLELPALPTLEHVQLVELPWEVQESRRTAVAVLVDRNPLTLTRAEVWYSPDDDSYGTEPVAYLDHPHLALRATMGDAGLPSDAASMTVHSTSPLTESLLVSRSIAEQADDHTLAFLGDEIVSIGAVSVVSAGVYTVSILRGRVGSPSVSRSPGSSVWVIRRRDLAPVFHSGFARGSTRHFRVVPGDAYRMAGLGDDVVWNGSITFRDEASLLPQVEWQTPATTAAFLQHLPVDLSVEVQKPAWGPLRSVWLVAYEYPEGIEGPPRETLLAYKGPEELAAVDAVTLRHRVPAVQWSGWAALMLWAESRYGMGGEVLWAHAVPANPLIAFASPTPADLSTLAVYDGFSVKLTFDNPSPGAGQPTLDGTPHRLWAMVYHYAGPDAESLSLTRETLLVHDEVFVDGTAVRQTPTIYAGNFLADPGAVNGLWCVVWVDTPHGRSSMARFWWVTF